METLFFFSKPGIKIVTVFLALIPCLVNAQEEKPTEMQQYLFPSFTVGKVKTKTGSPKNLMLNYNMASEKMVFEQKGNYYDLINQEAVDTIYLRGRKFIPYEKYFIEVVYRDSVSFGIRHIGNLQAPGKPVGYGGTSEVASSNYLTGIELSSGYFNFKLPEGYVVKYSPVYLVKKDGEWYKFLGEKQYLKIFPEKQDDLKLFIKKNRIKFDRVEDLVRLAEYCNKIIK